MNLFTLSDKTVTLFHTPNLRRPLFNEWYSTKRDPGFVLHGKLERVPGFSGRVRIFCYTDKHLQIT